MTIPVHLRKILRVKVWGDTLTMERMRTDRNNAFGLTETVAEISLPKNTVYTLSIGPYYTPKEKQIQYERLATTLARHIGKSIGLPASIMRHILKIPKRVATDMITSYPILKIGRVSVEEMPSEEAVMDRTLDRVYESLHRAGYALETDKYYIFYNPWNGKEIRFRKK